MQYRFILMWLMYIFRAISKSNCYHKEGQKAPCKYSNNPFMVALGIVEILLSQIPNFHKLSWLSTIAAIMSFSYAGIGMGLAFAKIVSGNLLIIWLWMHFPYLEKARIWTGQGQNTTLTGVEIGPDLTAADKTWRMFQAIGNLAFACSYSAILIEIQVRQPIHDLTSFSVQ